MLGYLPQTERSLVLPAFIETTVNDLRQAGQKVSDVGDHYETRDGSGALVIILKD